MTSYLTANDIAVRENIPLRTVQHRLKRSGIIPAERLGKLYKYRVEDVGLVFAACNKELVHNVKDDERKNRCDFGTVRVHSEQLVQIAIMYAKEYFLDGALPDVYFACEQAVKRIHREWDNGAHRAVATEEQVRRLTTEWLYKGRVKRRDGENSKNTQRFVGEFWTQGWEGLHLRKWRQHNAALSSAHVRYNIPAIMESAGHAGEGFGFGKLIMLDDRSADAWSENGEEYTLPTGVYVWDVLTGALLWVEQSDTIGAGTYIRALLTTAYTWGFADNPLFFMENAKASTAKRVIGAVSALYTQEELRTIESGCCELRRKLAHGTTTPVVYNIPHIPRHIGKATGERRFGVVKREYDAQKHALTYQGANRDEAVQLHTNNQHWVLVSNPNRPAVPLDRNLIPSRQFYFSELMNWAYSEYLSRPRVSLKAWARERGCDNNILSMVNHYYSVGCTRKPDNRQLSYLLYWSQTKQQIVTCRTSGALVARREYTTINITSSCITHEYIGRKIAYIETPGTPGEYQLYVVDDVARPQYIGFGHDMTARTLDDVPQMRATVRQQRTETHNREWDTIKQVSKPTAEPTTPLLELPVKPHFIEQMNVADSNDVEVIEVEVEVVATQAQTEYTTNQLSARARQALNL